MCEEAQGNLTYLGDIEILIVLEKAQDRLKKENIVREELLNTDDIQDLYDKVGRW